MKTVVVNRSLSVLLLLAGLGLLYQSFNNQSWLIKSIEEVLAPPKTAKTDIKLSVGGETKIAPIQKNSQENPAAPTETANLGAKDLSLDSSNTEKKPLIKLTSLEGGATYPEDSKSDGVLKLKTDCWIEIKDSSQKVLVSGHNKKGKEFILDRTKTPFTAKAVCKPENLDFLIDGKKASFKFNKKGSSYLLNLEF